MSRSASGGTTYDVYVGNLTSEVTENQIKKKFQAFGEIQSLTLLDNRNGPGKVAFVRFLQEGNAEKACNAHGTLDLNGKKLFIRKAKKAGSSGEKKMFTNRSPCESTSSNSGPDIVPFSDDCERRAHSSESDGPNMEVLKEEQVIVTHVESAICLWVQTITANNAQALNSLVDKLEQTCPAASKVKGTPITGKHYGTKFSVDEMWYRCSVLQLDSIKAKVKVLFIDYGNTEEKEMNELVEIPQSLANIQPFAKKIVLHGLAVKNESGIEPGAEFIRELTESEFLTAHLTIPLRDQMGYFGDLLIGDKSINEMVIQQGFATRRSMSQKPFKSNMAARGSKSFPDSSSPQKSSSSDFHLTMSGSTKNKSPRNEVSEYKIKLEKERAEKDMLALELASLKGKLKSSQAELTTISNKIIQSTIGNQIREIVALAEKVRHLRSKFPTDGTTSDCISQSLSIALEEDHVSLDAITSLHQVNESLDEYTASQNAIKICQSHGDLPDLLELRDRSRQNLHVSLQLFLEESARMPLEQRIDKVKSVLESLDQSYGAFLQFIVNKDLSLETAKTIYHQWKERVVGVFEGTRIESNLAQEAISSTLSQLQQLMSLDGQLSSSLPNTDLDGLFKKYLSALQKEVEVTDVQHSNDACVMASVIHEVKRVFEEELKIIQSVRCLKDQFSQQKISIEEWLSYKPDLQDIREVRKQLRGLKSKLRHLLADKEDIDENEDGSDGENQRIQTELSSLRCDLQKTVLKEEGLLRKYAMLQEEHFPEFRLTNSDLNLEVCQMYHGLLKTNREIDYYDLTPCPKQIASYQATFGGNPVVLQEYVIDDQIHSSKADFMKQALTYAQIQNANLMPIEAVFLSKNQRQLFVQTPALGVSLKELVQRDEIKPWVMQKILRCLVECLVALHEAGIVHGDISPQSVIVTEGKTAMLSLPDFSRPPVDPSRTWYTTESGLEFRAPEEDHTPTSSSDLFSLGLLFIWINLPNVSLERNEKGTFVLSNLQIDEEICCAAQALLCTDPSSRVMARDILQIGYFQNIIPDLLHVESGSDSTSPEKGDPEDLQCDEMNEKCGDFTKVEESSTSDRSTEVINSAPEDVYSSQEAIHFTPERVNSMFDFHSEPHNSKPDSLPEDTPLPAKDDMTSFETKGDNPGTNLDNGDDLQTSTPPDSVDNSIQDASVETSAHFDISANIEQESSIGAEAGQFNFPNSTLNSISSISSNQGHSDGSGDNQKSVHDHVKEEPIDNATLIENLLSLTAQHQSKNLSF